MTKDKSNAQQVATLQDAKKVDNPYRAASVVKDDNQNALIAAEAQKAMIETMTAFEVAKRFPRDPVISADKILRECERPTLAELSTYSYKRAGTPIEGPTIRLMEAIARAWGNIKFGWKVIDTNKERSLIRAFAFDLESNIDRSTEFSVRHWRDTQSGGYALKDERDIYELCSNQAMRRVRGCLEGLIPRDVIDMALEKCEETNKANVDTSAEGLLKLLNAFKPFGVNQAMLEARFQGQKLNTMKAPQIVGLRKIHAALREGVAKVDDFFDTSLADKPKDEPKTEGADAQPDLKAEIDKTKKQDDQKAAAATETPAAKTNGTPGPEGKQGKLV